MDRQVLTKKTNKQNKNKKPEDFLLQRYEQISLKCFLTKVKDGFQLHIFHLLLLLIDELFKANNKLNAAYSGTVLFPISRVNTSFSNRRTCTCTQFQSFKISTEMPKAQCCHQVIFAILKFVIMRDSFVPSPFPFDFKSPFMFSSERKLKLNLW